MSADTYKAAKCNNVGFFRRLLGSSRSVDVVDYVLESITLCGKTVAHVAAIFNIKQVMEEILLKNEYLRCQGLLQGRTTWVTLLFIWLALLGTIRLLLQINGMVVYRKSNVNGRFPNHEAAIEGRIEVYRELVERFSDIEDLFDTNGENAFHMAIKENKFDLVQHILETSKNKNWILARVKGSGSTALHIAVKELIWIVFLLLDDERTVAQRTLHDKNSRTPADIMQSIMAAQASQDLKLC